MRPWQKFSFLLAIVLLMHGCMMRHVTIDRDHHHPREKRK